MNETDIELAALGWLQRLGYDLVYGPDIAPGQPAGERERYANVTLEGRLRRALVSLNPKIPTEAIEEAFGKLIRPTLPTMVLNNHLLHQYLVQGVPVEYQRQDGSIGGDLVRVFDYEAPENNEFLAVNQYTVVETGVNGGHERRPDVVVFVNGLPVAVLELKNAADPNATIWNAFNQLQTYKKQIPSLFHYNQAMVISDGVQARIGTLTASREWFMPWRTIEGEELADNKMPELQVVLEGVFEKRRLLDLIRHFIVFEDAGGGVLTKKMAGYHQYHAVNLALASTVKAAGKSGDKRVGVVWHTQGSGKSLTMAFYAGRVVLEPAMGNPTLVVLTDRNDLDDQLFGTFARCHDLLRQQPVQAQSRTHLRELLKTDSGGVVFTTVQKFFSVEGMEPCLSNRRNIVVIADEAHRSQYDFIDGFAISVCHHQTDCGQYEHSIPPSRGQGVEIPTCQIIANAKPVRGRRGNSTHIVEARLAVAKNHLLADAAPQVDVCFKKLKRNWQGVELATAISTEVNARGLPDGGRVGQHGYAPGNGFSIEQCCYWRIRLLRHHLFH